MSEPSAEPFTGATVMTAAGPVRSDPLPEQTSALGTRVVVTDPDTAADAMVARAVCGAGGYVCFCNVHVLIAARSDPALRAALNGAWAVFADGAPVAWLQRRLGAPGARRIAGPDLMPAVFERGCEHSLRHFLFGSTEPVLEALRSNLRARFPDARIVGLYAPPRGCELDGERAELISRCRPHIVWCGLGAPRQETWMARQAAELAPALVVGVGAAFDFNAGTRSRAPVWMRDHGLEWLHRLVKEPRRLTRRYVTTNSRFMVLAASELARRRWR